MPIYEYECQECGHKFELLRRISQNDSDIKCPKCGSDKIEREFSAFASYGDSLASNCSGGGGRFT